jgi:hypothetical protein
MDIDAPVPRRSERIASMAVKMSVDKPEVAPKVKKILARASVSNEKKTPLRKRQSRKSVKKVKDVVMTVVQKTYEEWKISDLLPLVKKYSLTNQQCSFYRSVLQTVLKSLNELNIVNKLSQFKQQRDVIVAFVSEKFGINSEAIDVVFDVMMSYTEVKEAEAQVTNEQQTYTLDDILCGLISSFNAVKI